MDAPGCSVKRPNADGRRRELMPIEEVGYPGGLRRAGNQVVGGLLVHPPAGRVGTPAGIVALDNRALLYRVANRLRRGARPAGRVVYARNARRCMEVTVATPSLHCICLRARVVLCIPRLKLPEQRFPVGVRPDVSRGRVLVEKRLKALPLDRLTAMPVEPLLRERQTVPAGKRRRQGDLFPLGMKRRILQLRDPLWILEKST